MARLLIVAAAALIDGDGRVLLAKRPAGKAMAGLWEFPGGKLEDSETPEEALVRELREELGIDVETACLAPIAFASQKATGSSSENSSENTLGDDGLGSSADLHLLMPLFVCRKWKGVARAIEADEIAWVRPNEFTKYEMPPADRPLASQLRDML
ncbi:MAG: (deoxy)nucleoside triphosphate pyrophosphohydrolase [Parvularculaceae bacterium]